MKTVSATLALLMAAAPAAAATIDFSGNICDGPGGTCSNYALIAQGYGSIAGEVEVVYDRDVLNGTPDEQLSWWDGNYSDLQGVAWGGVSGLVGRPEIFLRPLPGYTITLESFRLGAWPNSDRTTQVSVLDGLMNVLYASAPGITIAGLAASTFTGPWSSSTGIRIQWGPDGYNVGIDDIVFSVRPTAAVVPLPAPVLLLGAALGALGLVRRRRAA